MSRALIAGFAILTLAACAPKEDTSARGDPWEAFWHSVKVEPAPRRDFLEGPFNGKILNLTDGRLPDDTVEAWVLADMRRGRGDLYASYNLRRDIADADVFGPPGLNGTGEGIRNARQQGLVRVKGPLSPDVVAAAVIWISPAQRQELASFGLTEYVIVQAYRRAKGRVTRVYRDGHIETDQTTGAADVYWQLDCGHFVDHPVLGPLWYQSRGWTCKPDDGTPVGEICGRVMPESPPEEPAAGDPAAWRPH
jgi:hypothetical protein